MGEVCKWGGSRVGDGGGGSGGACGAVKIEGGRMYNEDKLVMLTEPVRMPA